MSTASVAVATFAATLAILASCPPARAAEGASEAAGSPGTPTLEWLRDCIVGRGIAPRLVKIEATVADDSPDRAHRAAEPGARRLVFWTKTRRLTQTVIVAIVGDGAYVRIQSSRLASAPKSHPHLEELLAYVLDRNFAMSGAQYARDAGDGEVVIRADVPCAAGLREATFLQVLESVVRAADEEAPRLWAVLGRQ